MVITIIMVIKVHPLKEIDNQVKINKLINKEIWRPMKNMEIINQIISKFRIQIL